VIDVNFGGLERKDGVIESVVIRIRESVCDLS
jgi:hypothetical protein